MFRKFFTTLTTHNHTWQQKHWPPLILKHTNTHILYNRKSQSIIVHVWEIFNMYDADDDNNDDAIFDAYEMIPLRHVKKGAFPQQKKCMKEKSFLPSTS